MRFTADRGPLLEAVQRVQGAAGNGRTVPILGNVLLRTEGDRLALRTTDSNIEATAYALATVDAHGEACVPVDQLAELLKSLPEGGELGVTLAPGDPRLGVVCGRSRFKLPCLPPGDFPTWPDDEGKGAVVGTIKADQLARLIDKTLFAASNDEARYYLGGIYLHVGASGELRSVATNGANMAFASTGCPESLAGLPAVIVPIRMAAELRRWLGASQADVELCVSPARLRVTLGERQLRGLNVDGRFPDYQRVIPVAPPNQVRLDLGLLRAAVRRVAVAAQAADKTRVKVMRAALSSGQVRLSSRSAERGEAQEDLEAQYDGPDVEIAVSVGPFLEIAERIVGDTLAIGFGAPTDPLLITDPADEGVRFVTATVR